MDDNQLFRVILLAKPEGKDPVVIFTELTNIIEMFTSLSAAINQESPLNYLDSVKRAYELIEGIDDQTIVVPSKNGKTALTIVKEDRPLLH